VPIASAHVASWAPPALSTAATQDRVVAAAAGFLVTRLIDCAPVGRKRRRERQRRALRRDFLVDERPESDERRDRAAAASDPVAPATKDALTLAHRYAGPAALALLVLAFLVLQAWSLLPHPADEGIYFYGASRIARGRVPYRDFFFAHPPLHLLPNALLFALLGPSLPLAKLATVLGGAFQGVAAYAIASRSRALGPSRALAQAGGVLAAAALLGCETLLKASANDTGIAQASGWLAASALALALGRPALGGVLAAAATSTLIQAAPIALALAGAAWALGDRRVCLRFVAGAGGTIALVHVLFAAIAGRAFFDQVYLYHLAKTDRPGEGARQLGYVLADNSTLFVGAAVGAVALGLAGGRARRAALVAAGAIALQLGAMATRPRVFPFYFVPALFPATLLFGAGAAVIGRAWRERSGAPSLRTAVALAAAFVAGTTLVRWPLISLVSPGRAAQRERYTQTYDWVDAPGIGPLNAVVRALVWQDGERRAGSDPNAATQYLWQRTRWLDTLPELVARVRDHARAHPGTSLFGDSSVAPLVAFEAGVPIVGDVVDTNVERVRTGTLPMAEVLALLDTSPDTLVLVGRDGIGGYPELRERLSTSYAVVAELTSRTGERHALWARRR
jgi:hypothetical protein